jgi:hypothetical protein
MAKYRVTDPNDNLIGEYPTKRIARMIIEDYAACALELRYNGDGPVTKDDMIAECGGYGIEKIG